MDLITRRVIREREGDHVTAETLAAYTDPDSPQYQAMVDEICRQFNFTTLRFNRLDDMIEATGLPREKLCTYCWDGKE